MATRGCYQPCEHLQALRTQYPSLAALGQELSCGSGPAAPALGHVVCLACSETCPRSQAHAHAAGCGAEHSVALDVARAELFCALCRDFVYDDTFDRGVLSGRQKRAHGEPSTAAPASPPPSAKRRHRGWGALLEHLQPPLLPASSGEQAPPGRPIMTPILPEQPPLGLRGLNNLGNTCFMSSVLQSLFCVAPLKAHFLSGAHCARVCHARRAARSAAAAAASCLACELDGAFQAAFRPSNAPQPTALRAASRSARAPWSPHALLAAWWTHAESLASYQQQDAHEFLISLIAGAHAAVSRGAGGGLLRSASGVGSPMGSPCAGGGEASTPGGGSVANLAAWAPEDCGCALHSTFGGILRSDVTCGSCGAISTAFDPFVDVSLELLPEGTSAQTSTSLGACLRRFSRDERLGSTERITCRHCGGPQPGSKQMCVQRLPPALCLHIKRFSHSAVKQASHKVQTHVAFPLDVLDMGPFTAASLLHARAGHRVCAPARPDDVAPSAAQLDARYWLVAVVCHLGSIEGGHYVAYVRHASCWFKCDDSWVTQVEACEVAASQAYLLFYQAHAITAQAPDEREF